MAASQDLSSYFALIASKMIPPPLPLLLLRSALLNKLHLSESSSDIKKNLDNEKSALKSKKNTSQEFGATRNGRSEHSPSKNLQNMTQLNITNQINALQYRNHRSLGAKCPRIGNL